MKIGFVTCVELGLSCIEAIYEAGYKLDTIYTLHDNLARRKSGRIFVDEFAKHHSINVIKLAHVNDPDAVKTYRSLDWLFIVGWSQIASRDVIDAPSKGVLGMHPSLLPQGRGRAAIPWAILKNLDKTGVTLFKLDEGVDTGPILAQREIPLTNSATATTLYREVAEAQVSLVTDVLPKMAAGTVSLVEQDESRATTWPGRRPEDGAIDLYGSAMDAERLVRAVTHPYPGAYFIDERSDKVLVWSAKMTGSEPKRHEFLRFRDGYLALLETEKAS